MSATDRRLAATIAAHESWARTPDRTARTAKARAALMATFETKVDPEGVLPPHERARRAEHLKKAHFARLALRSAQSRRRANELAADASAAEAELTELGGGDPNAAA